MANNGFKDLNTTPAALINGINAELPLLYRDQLPTAQSGQTDFGGIGKVLSSDAPFANQWHQTAINLISRIIQRDNMIVDPLAEYEDDTIVTGDKIEEMIMDTARMSIFNPSRAEKTLFDRRAPELRAVIHHNKRDVSAKVTNQDTVITDIFRNASEIDRYLIQSTLSLINGNRAEKYYFTKQIVSLACEANVVRKIDMGSNATSENIQKLILAVAKMMIKPSRMFNMGNVGQPGNRGESGIQIQADFTKLRMWNSIETSVNLSVDFFANVFHRDAVESGLAITDIDFFPNIYRYNDDHVVTQADHLLFLVDDEEFPVGSTILKGTLASEQAYTYANGTNGDADIDMTFDASRIKSVIFDKRAIMRNPMLEESISSVINPQGRYINIFLNDKALFSYSPFMPSTVILGDPDTSSSNIFDFIKDVKVDGNSVVDSGGVANINYSDETAAAANSVFGAVTSPEADNFNNPEIQMAKSQTKKVEDNKNTKKKPSRKKTNDEEEKPKE